MWSDNGWEDSMSPQYALRKCTLALFKCGAPTGHYISMSLCNDLQRVKLSCSPRLCLRSFNNPASERVWRIRTIDIFAGLSTVHMLVSTISGHLSASHCRDAHHFEFVKSAALSYQLTHEYWSRENTHSVLFQQRYDELRTLLQLNKKPLKRCHGLCLDSLS